MIGYSEACARNQEPIRQVLSEWIRDPGLLLEIGSGSGQHALYLGGAFPQLRWQPTDVAQWLPALRQNLCPRPANVLEPLELDLTHWPWPVTQANMLFTANTLHIVDWPSVEALLRGAGKILSPAGLMLIYGPFRYRNSYTSDSNASFDLWLKQRDPASGIRDFEALESLAATAGLALVQDYAMPANNQLLVWRRD